MTNVEKVTEKLNELTKAIKELGGCVLIIGNVPNEANKNESCIIGCIAGKQTDIMENVARVYGNSEEVWDIIKTGCAQTSLLKLTGNLKADKVEETRN